MGWNCYAYNRPHSKWRNHVLSTISNCNADPADIPVILQELAIVGGLMTTTIVFVWIILVAITSRMPRILKQVELKQLEGKARTALQGKKSHGIDQSVLVSISRQIKEIRNLKVDVALVLGAGNIFRGQENTASLGLDMDRSVADYMGMLATVMNALALQNSLEKVGLQTRVLSAIEMRELAEPYIRRRAYGTLRRGGS
jgi:hypothetical protein